MERGAFLCDALGCGPNRGQGSLASYCYGDARQSGGVNVPGPKMTEIGMRLTVAESRAAAVAEIVEVYRRKGSIEATAEALGIGRRTLDRWINQIPELASGIVDARQQMRPW